MPRGVYPRKSAERKTAGKATAKAKAAPRTEKPAKAPPAVTLAAVVTAPASEGSEPRQFSAQDFKGSVDDMSGELLHAYARSIGIQQRDVDGLTEDRLRQNCKARLIATIEDD